MHDCPPLYTELTFYCEAEPALNQTKGYVVCLNRINRYQIAFLPEEYNKSDKIQRAILTFESARADDSCDQQIIDELENACKDSTYFPKGCNIDTLGFLAIDKEHFEFGVVRWSTPSVLEQIIEGLQKEIL